MADQAERARKSNRCFTLVMLLLMTASFAYLTYGPAFDTFFPGFGALIAIPFALGALAEHSSGGNGPYNRFGCIIAPLALFAAIFLLVSIGFGEGLICIAMLLPFWLVAGLGGALASWHHRRLAAQAGEMGEERLRAIGLALLPFVLITAEEHSPAPWQERSVERSVWIPATPDAVWPLLLSIPKVTENEGKSTMTHDWLGVPRPSGATLIRRDGNLIREADWGPTVRFEEHVTRLMPGKEVAWRFVFPDMSVQQHTDKHVSPDGPILKIAYGGYKLAPADGGTMVTLTTTYRMRTRLGWYLALWGEQMLGDVQENVLEVIRQRAVATNR